MATERPKISKLQSKLTPSFTTVGSPFWPFWPSSPFDPGIPGRPCYKTQINQHTHDENTKSTK